MLSPPLVTQEGSGCREPTLLPEVPSPHRLSPGCVCGVTMSPGLPAQEHVSPHTHPAVGWGGEGSGWPLCFPMSHSIFAPQCHQPQWRSPSSCPARVAMPRGEPGLRELPSSPAHGCQSRAGPSRATQFRLPRAGAVAGDTAEETAVVTPEDTGLRVRVVFLQGAGVPFPPAAPPQPDPAHGSPPCVPSPVGSAWAG